MRRVARQRFKLNICITGTVTVPTFPRDNISEFLGPAVLNALGLAAFNYDFRDDGEDRAEFAASLRDFMCVHTSNPFVGCMMS